MTKRKPLIVGNYKFTGRILGKGNFARVEEAFHELLGLKVAVKIMDLNNIKEDYVVRNLFRESKIMAKLKHPCIVSLFETMQKSDNIYYLVTEIVNGGDLCTYVKSQRAGKLDERSAKFFGQQFVSALSYMHQKGIVHRDLKMENVMLNSSQNQIKIVDFGLSNEWTADCPLKTHCGSPEYAAPELFVTGKVYGPEVDLWSLGIILYGMVVGQLPFLSNKAPSLTSQERRKLLVAQINRGISSTQKKALANFSLEFRSLMNKLLNAESKKRLTIRQMILHPWITENGTRFVKTNPSKRITPLIRNKILNEISILCTISSAELNKSLRERPLGNMGGMYNILSHRVLIRPVGPEHLTRSLSETDTDRRQREIDQKSASRYFEDTVEKIELVRPHTVSEACYTNRTRIILNPQIIFGSNHLSLSKESGSKNSSSTPTRKPRPRSAFTAKQNSSFGEKRPLTSALRKRQEYSATVASKVNPQIQEKSKKGVKDDLQESLALKRRIEYLHKSIPQKSLQSRNILAREVVRSPKTDKNTAKKSPRTPSPKRKVSTDRSPTPKSTTDKPTPKKGSSSRPATLQALMKFFAPQCDKIQGGSAEAQSSSKRNSRRSPQRTSAVSRSSDTEAKKIAGKLKAKSKHSSSCRSNIETNTRTKQKSVVLVNESLQQPPSYFDHSEKYRRTPEACRDLPLYLSRNDRNSKIVHSIPPNRYDTSIEPYPEHARGDHRSEIDIPPTKTKEITIDAKYNSRISRHILNYLQRN